MELADRIKQRITELGLTMSGVSHAMGRGESFVRDICRSKSRSPSAENLAELAKHLKTTSKWLLTGEDGNKNIDSLDELQTLLKSDDLAVDEREIIAQEVVDFGKYKIEQAKHRNNKRSQPAKLESNKD